MVCTYTCYNELLERLFSDEFAGKYEIVQDENELRIAGRAVREICSTDIVVINVDKNVLVIPFVFVEEETGEIFAKYMEVLKKARALNLPVMVVLDDCDRQLLTYIGALREALKLATPQAAFLIATYATLLTTHAETAQTYAHAKEGEDKYFEYQLALEKTAHYLNLLVKQLSTIRDVEALLDAVQKSLRSVIDAKEAFNQVIGEVLGFRLEPAEINLVKNELAACPANILMAVKRLQQRAQVEGKQAYVLVPKQVKNFLKGTLPEETLVGV